MPYVKWFTALTKSDIAKAGGKGANLGELTQAKIPVPPGFVVLSSAYFDFLAANKLRPQIHRLLSVIDPNRPDQLQPTASKIQKLILTSPIPTAITQDIFTAYHNLGGPVAVRSSATAEDLPEASFAGQQSSFLNVVGDAVVLAKVRECWASLFEPRSIFYRHQKHFDHFQVGIAVPVQSMIQSEVSGIMFTVDPMSQDKDVLVIEAIYGLGDYIVQGVVTPDHYVFQKNTGKLLSKTIASQTVMEIRTTQGVKSAKVPASRQAKQKISDSLLSDLVALGIKIQQHYYYPQDIEWALADGKLFITQSRPITTLNSNKDSPFSPERRVLSGLTKILSGAGASPGIISGPVSIVTNLKYLSQVKSGDILVTDMTTPDFVPAMLRAAGIVTNKGGLTSHAAIISRELGVPCVVGTKSATTDLTDGMVVTVNGSTGEVFKGGSSPQQPTTYPTTHNSLPLSKTATKIYVNLSEPSRAEEVALQPVDGVGLLRAEFMMAQIGVHPKHMLATGRGDRYIDQLAAGLLKFAQEFTPRPVIYRASDFRTNEYRGLKGGAKYEPEEANPMLGFRGAFRYITNPEVFELELAAIKQVRRHHLSNLHLMIPFVRTPAEMVAVKKIVAGAGLARGGNFKLWMMAEIPSNVILLDDFIDAGIDGISIGSNDLTMLMLGTDRDNAEVATEFDERNPAVLWALEKIITTCHRRKITCSICGQAASTYPDLVEKLISWGITSVSVNPDAIDRTRQLVAHSEANLIRHATTQ